MATKDVGTNTEGKFLLIETTYRIEGLGLMFFA
jgi:hypothetical protein